MNIKTKEHYDVIEAFERAMPHMRFTSGRLDKEQKEMWSKGFIYQCGETNNLFLAFRHGVAHGKSVYQN